MPVIYELQQKEQTVQTKLSGSIIHIYNNGKEIIVEKFTKEGDPEGLKIIYGNLNKLKLK